jgi:hypothetical protein
VKTCLLPLARSQSVPGLRYGSLTRLQQARVSSLGPRNYRAAGARAKDLDYQNMPIIEEA